MPERYIRKILRAQVYDVAVKTPLEEAPSMSARLQNTVLFKREDLQPVFSFKLRGAYAKMVSLTEEQAARGVICASAGNHAQGVALSAKTLGIKAVIVMPKTTPDIKVRSVRERGGRVVLHGDSFDEALAHAQLLEERDGLTFVHPYDDPDVIAGQGTIAMEIMQQRSGALDAIFVPVGGGGLAAGIAVYMKYVRPEVKIIAVEPEDSSCLKTALERQRRVTLNDVGLFADGVAVKQIGKETFRILRDTIDGVVTVSTDEICAAVKDVFEDTRSITEPAGALALAGMKKWVAEHEVTGQTLVAIQSGANINFDRLKHIAERTELGEQREAILAVTIPERPGSFKQFCQIIGRRDITEFNYRFRSNDSATVFVGVRIHPDSSDLDELIEALESNDYPVANLTQNETAKLHVRHMVGGYAGLADIEELVYRVEFPERPGALLKFLTSLKGRWNISLFHYRNHGAAYGRVLVGWQVPKGERTEFRKEVKALDYTMVDETNNPAYTLFLG